MTQAGNDHAIISQAAYAHLSVDNAQGAVLQDASQILQGTGVLQAPPSQIIMNLSDPPHPPLPCIAHMLPGRAALCQDALPAAIVPGWRVQRAVSVPNLFI